ncbi:hypothetical protein D3C80_1254750 [compost metagenome]
MRAVVVSIATQGNVVVGAVVIHHRISDRTRSRGFQLCHVDRVRIVCTGRQPGNTTIAHVHFTLRCATDQVRFMRQGAAISQRTGTQSDAAIGTGNSAHTDGYRIQTRRHRIRAGRVGVEVLGPGVVDILYGIAQVGDIGGVGRDVGGVDVHLIVGRFQL